MYLERERERESCISLSLSLSIYIYIYICTHTSYVASVRAAPEAGDVGPGRETERGGGGLPGQYNINSHIIYDIKSNITC